jgi:hypothetical protein
VKRLVFEDLKSYSQIVTPPKEASITTSGYYLRGTFRARERPAAGFGVFLLERRSEASQARAVHHSIYRRLLDKSQGYYHGSTSSAQFIPELHSDSVSWAIFHFHARTGAGNGTLPKADRNETHPGQSTALCRAIASACYWNSANPGRNKCGVSEQRRD